MLSKNTNQPELKKMENALIEGLNKLGEYEKIFNTHYIHLITPEGEYGGINHSQYAEKHFPAINKAHKEVEEIKEKFIQLSKKIQEIEALSLEQTSQLKNLEDISTKIKDSFEKIENYASSCKGLLMYYNSFYNFFLRCLKNKLFNTLPNQENPQLNKIITMKEKKKYTNSLQVIWEYMDLLYQMKGKFLPINFQQMCFLLRALEKHFPASSDKKSKIQQYISNYFTSYQVATELLGPKSLLSATVYISTLNALIFHYELRYTEYEPEIKVLQRTLEAESEKLYKLINDKSNNTIFSHISYILNVTLPTISANAQTNIEYCYSNEWLERKNNQIIPDQFELEEFNVVVNEIKQVLDEAFIYYKTTILPHEGKDPVIVHNCQQTLFQCCQSLIESLLVYFEWFECIIKQENELLESGYYKTFEEIDIISNHLFILEQRYKIDSHYFLDTLMNNITLLLNDIKESKFPNTASFEGSEQWIILYDPEQSKKNNDEILESRKIELEDINNTCKQIPKSVEIATITLQQEIKNTNQQRQRFLKAEEEAKKRKQRAVENKKVLPTKESTKASLSQQPNKAPNTKEPPNPQSPKERILKKTLSLEKVKPLTPGWNRYYEIAKSWYDNPMFSVEECKKLLNTARVDKELILVAACCQELAHYYYTLGKEQFDKADCKELLAFSQKTTLDKSQKTSPELLKDFSKKFYSEFDKRTTQLTTLMTIYQKYNTAIHYLKEAREAIKDYSPSNQRDKKTTEAMQYGVEFIETIVKNSQDILSNLNSLFLILNTHRSNVIQKKGPKKWRPKTGDDKTKSPEATIFCLVIDVKNFFTYLFYENQDITSCSLQALYVNTQEISSDFLKKHIKTISGPQQILH